MKNQLMFFMAIILSTMTANLSATEMVAFRVDCPEEFSNCYLYIGQKVTAKFSKKYPPNNWKIVVPLARFFVLGNGTLKGHLALAVVPDTDFLTTKDLNSFESSAKQPKKQFVINKYWPDILALNEVEFSDEKRFNPIPDMRFYRARTLVYIKMVEEAATAMMDECDKSENCNLYEE